MPANELDAFLAFLIGKLPKVTVTQKFGHVNFTVKKKVFAFTQPEGLVVKLPLERAKQLASQKKAVLLVMGKREMKEWVILKHLKPGDYRKDLGLFKESVAFVSSKK